MDRAKVGSWPSEFEGQKKYYRLSSLPEEVRSLLSPSVGADPGDAVGASPDRVGDPPSPSAVVDAVGAAPTVEAEGDTIERAKIEYLKPAFGFVDFYPGKLKKAMEIVDRRNILIVGRNGGGKTFMLKEIVRRLNEAGKMVLFYAMPPTTGGLVKDLCKAMGVDLGPVKTADDRLEVGRRMNEYQGPMIFVCIDEGGKMSDTLVDLLGLVLVNKNSHVRFVSAGHFGQGWKKRAGTLKYCEQIFLDHISQSDAVRIVGTLFPGLSPREIKKIVDDGETEGRVEFIMRRVEDKKAGRELKSTAKFFDSTPVFFVVLYVFGAVRFWVGREYNDPDMTIGGAVTLGVTTLLFGIWRGYCMGMFGMGKNKDKEGRRRVEDE